MLSLKGLKQMCRLAISSINIAIHCRNQFYTRNPSQTFPSAHLLIDWMSPNRASHLYLCKKNITSIYKTFVTCFYRYNYYFLKFSNDDKIIIDLVYNKGKLLNESKRKLLI